MRRHLLETSLTLLIASVSVLAAAETSVLDSGPPAVRDRFVLDFGFLVFEPASPHVLPRGRWRVGATASLYTSWSQSDQVRRDLELRSGRSDLTLEQLQATKARGEGRGLFHADGEIHALELSLARGVGRGMEVWLKGLIFEASGGFADTLVEGFHDALTFSQASRDLKIRDDYSIYLRAADGRELYRSRGSGPEIGDLTLGLRKRLGGDEGRWSHSLEAALDLPTGSTDSLAGSGSVDLGLRYLGELDLNRARLRGSLAVVRHGSTDFAFLEAKTLLSLWLGYEHALGSRTSIALHASVGESRYRDANIFRLEDYVLLADLGVKRRLGRAGTLFAAITQNLNRGSSSDIGVHVGWLRGY